MLILIGQDSGSKVIPVSLGTAQPQQEKVVGSSPGQPSVQVENSLQSFFLMFSIIARVWLCGPLRGGCRLALSAVRSIVHESVFTGLLVARPPYVNAYRMNVSILFSLQCYHFLMS